MPVFSIYDHPQMPVVMVRVCKRRENSTKDGFRLRYCAELSAKSEEHADDVISTLDEAMGTATKAHGVYQAKYDDVRRVYEGLLNSVGSSSGGPTDTGLLRALALMAGICLTIAMVVIVPMVTIFWLVVCAFKRQSGLVTMGETFVMGNIFDWRPLIHKLFHYSQSGKWPSA